MKENKIGMDLCSASLKKISELVNRGSRQYVEEVDVNEGRRKNKREDYVKKLIEEEIEKIA